MHKMPVWFLCVLALVVLLLPATPALAQSSIRTNIRNGDVWTFTSSNFGGFVGIMISWTKKADFDMLVVAELPSGEQVVVCRGLSTQDGFERCHFGQGNSKYLVQITTFSGAKKAKGAIWAMFSNENRTWSRTDGEAGPGLRYLGNIFEPGSDPVLQKLAQRAAEEKEFKAVPQQ